MNNLKIEITGTPPTQNQLAKWREEAHQSAARADAAERRITRWNWIMVTVFVLILVSLLLGIGPNVGYTLTSVAAAVAGAVAAAAAAAVAVAVVGVVAAAAAGVGAVVVAVVGVVAVAVAAAGVGAVSGALAAAGAVAVAAAVAVAMAAAGVPYDKWVEKPRTLARELLETLTELSPDQHATECAAYFGWFEKDETVQRYQRQVAAQERNPIMAEYRAAKLWVTTADERQAQAEKIEKARVACERLRTADL